MQGAEVVPLESGWDRCGQHDLKAIVSLPLEPFAVTGFEDYVAKLKRAKRGILERRAERGGARSGTTRPTWRLRRGWRWSRTRGCWPKSSGLVEWPVVLMGGYCQ